LVASYIGIVADPRDLEVPKPSGVGGPEDPHRNCSHVTK
jgi:hypothetical protein